MTPKPGSREWLAMAEALRIAAELTARAWHQRRLDARSARLHERAAARELRAADQAYHDFIFPRAKP